jgi:DNA-binding transcriptional LysR family regulator
MDRYFQSQQIEPAFAVEIRSNETIKQAVIAGMGIAFLSLHTIGLELKAGLIAVPDIEDLPLVKRWYIVNTLAKTLSPAAEAFRYFMLEQAERFLAQEYGAPMAADAREPA